ncbi:MAG: right-handed parallel beta-helix repeat-containing protein [Clostridia bacterium]
MILHGYWSWDWADRYIKPVHWDMEKHIVEVESRVGTYDIRTNARFRYINVLEELDCPGEWYADRRSGKLYFWPPDAFEGGVCRSVHAGGGISYPRSCQPCGVGRASLLFGESDGSGNPGRSSHSAARLPFYNLGSSGVNAVDTTETLLDSCSFANMGDGGITISGGDRKTLTPSGNRITNCDIHHFGEWSRCYCLGISLSGGGNSSRSQFHP